MWTSLIALLMPFMAWRWKKCSLSIPSGQRTRLIGLLGGGVSGLGHAGLLVSCLFAVNLACRLVLAQPLIARVPKPLISCLFRVGDLRDKLGLEPHRALSLRSRNLFEGRARALQRFELLGETREIARVETCADLARIAQLPVLER